MEVSTVSPASSTQALAGGVPEPVLTSRQAKPQPTKEISNMIEQPIPRVSGNEAVEVVPSMQADRESLRLALVNEGARNYIADTFVVSDTTFTIIKDPYSGEYITRFRSLRDGTVTYIPEKEVMNYSPSRRYLGNLEEAYA